MEDSTRDKRVRKPVNKPFMEAWDIEDDELLKPKKRKRKQRASPTPRMQSPLDKDKPRWWNMSLLLYLVLKNAGTNNPLPRNVLIPAAKELHDSMLNERGLPKLYHGKTPDNTFSMILTENKDKLFKRVTLDGNKLQHFTLAFEPGNFKDAVKNYNEWMDLLIKHDWPILFSTHRDANDAPMDKGIIQSFDPLIESLPQSALVEPLKESTSIESIPIQDTISIDTISNQILISNQDIPKSLDDIVEIKTSTVHLSTCQMYL